jgi:hypothetical protein
VRNRLTHNRPLPVLLPNKVVIKRKTLMVLIGFNYLETPGKQVSLLRKKKKKDNKLFKKRKTSKCWL